MMISNGWTSVERPTPQTTIEAVMYSVNAHGLPALDQPATLERLARCDEAAKAQISERITKLIAAGMLQAEAVDG